MKKKMEFHVGRARVGRGKGPVPMASLNCLPDELLSQIVSFLPTKQAASTSILSKRWMTLFTFQQDLDFDDSIFCHPEEGKRDRPDIQENFRSFVDGLLALQGNSPIKKFSLKCGGEHEEVHLHRWISIALARGVSELHLSLTHGQYLPSNLYITKTVVKLTLGTHLFLDHFPSDISLPVLKVLFLSSVWFESQESFALFLAACPALEDLTIHQKTFPGIPHVISSKTITRLSITYDCVENFSFLSLDTPNVVNLYYFDFSLRPCPNFHLDSLVKATLDLHFFKGLYDPDVTELINGIRNVKMLHLTSSAVEVISEFCKGGLPVFKNLSEMCLVFPGSNIRRSKMLLPDMIEKSPNLKSLVLSGLDFCTYKHRFLGIYIPPNQVKFLRIMECQGSANELNHVSHFLLKMKSLEEVRVYLSASMDESKKMEIRKELLKLPNASSKLTMKVM